ncbi:MAG: ribosome maturation factor RimP [Acidimicrobiales bacterium]|jgi:ribosome maturation factor RimP|nr:ribosome maturation factor RimP [Acidimicrobiales bacterium]
MAIVDRVRELVLPIIEGEDVDLYDIEHNGGVLRIYVDARREAGEDDTGLDVEVIKRISRQVSRLLDETDPIPGRYTLEVSSPGLERPLRTAEHFRRAVGTEVKIKTMPQVEGDRRVQGVVVSADDDGVEVSIEDGTRRVGYDDISKARTVFEWGPTPKRGGPKNAAQNKTDTQIPEKKAPTS